MDGRERKGGFGAKEGGTYGAATNVSAGIAEDLFHPSLPCDFSSLI